ncbi:asparagine synthase (glutamine-hydrolyzing) [Methylomonas sp. MK1]|uniref:asparagine synthase (glutamine-hydrolyzing) n=1 Tax=Methylomonas sp. MK1 TaxID=1131552 RepID=UPI0003A609C5|nr:asparagine synthase (glutamine-hydrolyzing) [Methylomonas sp. MK1]
MCGINGIFLHNSTVNSVDADELLATRDYMYNRGPDGEGLWISNCSRVGFGHRRLAIIELSTLGAQPMHTDDGQLSITFNGEIYNHIELRKSLEAKGFVFRSHSDTEVLLHLYRDLGIEMVEHLRGMFAFALWDNRNRKLIIARDPYGIKPVYYSNFNGTFRFASQVKALLAGHQIDSSINSAGLVSFLLWGSASEPFTFYQNINILPAGHILEIDSSGKKKIHQYWDINNVIKRSCFASNEIPTAQAMEVGISAIKDSIKSHMVADVPIGTFLSAGLDSATITGLAQELVSEPITAITLAFEEFIGRSLDEVPVATEIARILGVRHNIVTARMNEVENELSTFLNTMDQPSIDGINTWFVSKAAKNAGLKVVLSGLGGDEMLGGYDTFETIPEIVKRSARYNYTPLLNNLFFNIHSFFAANFSHLNPNNSDILNMTRNITSAYQLKKGLFMPWELKHLIDNDMIREGINRLSEIAEFESVSNIDSDFGKIVALESKKYMRNQLLRDTDWIGMAHSLEIRVPLVDHVLLNSLVGLAANRKLGNKKEILPRSLSKRLDDDIINRPKTGFTIPIWRWLNNSNNFSAWKKNRYLRHKNIIPNKRWAYCILEQCPQVSNYLK